MIGSATASKEEKERVGRKWKRERGEPGLAEVDTSGAAAADDDDAT